MKIQTLSYLQTQADDVVKVESVSKNRLLKNSIHRQSVICESVVISPLDRALNYGDGCFTTMYANQTHISLFHRHLQRLQTDAQKLMIDIDINLIKQAVLLAAQELLNDDTTQCAIKIHVSRGVGGRGYQLPDKPTPQVLISFYQANPFVTKLCNEYQYRLQVAQLQLSTQPRLAGIKHLNRLEQILAKHELQSLDANDLLLCDQANNVIEATAANVFVYIENRWYTPDVRHCGVSGVFRQAVLDCLTSHKLPAIIKTLSIHDVQNAQSIFLCNALAHIVPVSHFEHNSTTQTYNMQHCMDLQDAMQDWLLPEHQVWHLHNNKDVL